MYPITCTSNIRKNIVARIENLLYRCYYVYIREPINDSDLSLDSGLVLTKVL